MSLTRPERVDAITWRDGRAIVSIFHFGDWENLDEHEEALRTKVRGTLDSLETPALRARLFGAFIAVELVCRETPPDRIRRICLRHGVTIIEPERT